MNLDRVGCMLEKKVQELLGVELSGDALLVYIIEERLDVMVVWRSRRGSRFEASVGVPGGVDGVPGWKTREASDLRTAVYGALVDALG